MVKKRIDSLMEPGKEKDNGFRLDIRKKGLDQTTDPPHCLAQMQDSGMQGLREQHCQWGRISWILGAAEHGMASFHVPSLTPPFVTS